MNLPAWVAEYKEKNLAAFQQAGLPTRKNERWKYTDVNALALASQASSSPRMREPIASPHLCGDHSCSRINLITINGCYQPEYSKLTELPGGTIICSLSEALQNHEDLLRRYWLNEIDEHKYPFAALNAAHLADGLFLFVPEQCELAQPIHLLSVMTGDNTAAHPRHIILLEKNSRARVVEEQLVVGDTACLLNKVTSIYLRAGAKLEYYKMQRECGQSTLINHTFVEQQSDSSALFSFFTHGGAFYREELSVALAGAGAECKTSGFYHTRSENQYVDHHVDIIHSAPHTKSEMLYKGILESKSRAVFNGRLHVKEKAQKILAYQANHNLLLSNQAEVYSKPELEIYADDVKCKHGASTGQIDENALFYLRSRGLEKGEAQKLLLAGFADEILQRVPDPEIRKQLKESMPC